MTRTNNNQGFTHEPDTRLSDISWEAFPPGLQATCRQFMQAWQNELGIEELREMSGLNDMTLSDLLAWQEQRKSPPAKESPPFQVPVPYLIREGVGVVLGGGGSDADDPIDRWFRETERDPAERVLCYMNCDIQHLAEYFLNRLLTEDEFDEAVHAISHLPTSRSEATKTQIALCIRHPGLFSFVFSIKVGGVVSKKLPSLAGGQ